MGPILTLAVQHCKPYRFQCQLVKNRSAIRFIFRKPNRRFYYGRFVDIWFASDATRFYGGYYNIMRNTMEKCGSAGGDGFNAKSSAIGNMAYNLVIGGATNGTKSASDGATAGECQFTMYNNSINDGYRNNGVFGARSESVEIENNSRALVYNNLMVDCEFGVRIAKRPELVRKFTWPILLIMHQT